MNRKLLPFIGMMVMMLSVQPLCAQNYPGGVTPSAWYNADAASTVFSDAVTPATDSTTLYQWNNVITTSNFPLVQTSASARPMFSNATNLVNFNSTVTFDGSNDYMQFTAPTGVNMIDRANGNFYASGFVNVQKRNGFIGFHASMDYPGLHVYSSNFHFLFFTGGPGYQGQSSTAIGAQTYFTVGSGWENGAGSSASYAAATVSFNGNRVDYNGNQLYNANTTTGARDFRIGADNNYGAFSGQLNEILVYENKLTATEMSKVETYLAIRNGSTYASGSQDYVFSSGAVAWSATGNVGYGNSIAGIMRDDNGSLYQKQAWSTNSGNQILIGVGTLANTNSGNSSSLTNGQALIWGDNGLAKAPSVVSSAFTGLSHLFASVWKVQNTGSVGPVRIAWVKGLNNLSLIQSSDAVFAAGDVVTKMSNNDVTINGVVYNYADVTLSDGEYFTLGAKLTGPGGVVDGLVMWHKADDGTVGAGSKNIWKDVSGYGRDVTQNNNANYEPLLVTDAVYTANSVDYAFNFNPFYYFDGSDDFFYRSNQGDYFPTNTSPGSVYGVMYNSAIGGYRTPYGWGDDDPNLSRAGEYYQFWRDNGLPLSLNVGASSLKGHIAGMIWKGSGSLNNGVYMNIDGRNPATTSYNIGTINNNTFQIGSEGWDLNGNGNEVHQGGIAEVFAYSEDHQNSTGDEKLRINSYLALKYGITLLDSAGNVTSNYLSSNSTVVWDTTTNMGFNENVAGIARDENSALYQKQSQSNRDGQQVLIGAADLANTNALNVGNLTDGQFLIWGDNGLAKVPSVSISGVTGVNYRFASVWKVQNTGNVGTVRFAWPAGLTNLTLVMSTVSDFSTILSSQAMTNTANINGMTYNYVDASIADGQFFTFAAQLSGPGGVSLDLRLWLRSDAGFTASEWTDFSGNDNHYTQTNASRQPFVAAQQYNFNPVIDFGTDGSDARFMVVPDGKPYVSDGTNSTLFTVSLSNKASGYSDIIGFGNTTTGTGLIQANNPTFTKIGDDIVIYPYTSSPAGIPDVEVNTLYLNDVSFTVGAAGIKYGQNGQTDSSTQTPTSGNVLHASGSVLGAQTEEREGYIGEVIAYERDITKEEKQRVRSYVAIKYGLTLHHNYIASNSTTIFWDTSVNIGYNNNIAGIARDDNGSLNQRQSHSINKGKQVVVSTLGLDNSNAANTIGLSDQKFLVWGDNGLAKGPGVALTGVAGVNSRFSALWKVQNTNGVGTVRVAWPKGLTNLKLIRSADDIIDATDTYADMSGTQTINNVEYAYADVPLTDGIYFTFAALVQAPGGVVNGLSHWYRADKLTVSNGDSTDLTLWTDFTSGVEVSQIGLSTLPKFAEGSATSFNFNPGINFTDDEQKIGNITEETIGSLHFNIFSLTKPGLTGTRFFNIGKDNSTFTGSNWDHPGLYTNGGIARRNVATTLIYNGNPGNMDYANDKPSIMFNTFTDVSISRGLNAAPYDGSATHTAIGAVHGGHIFGSNRGDITGGDDLGFIGMIGELIIYGNDTITAVERNKVETYLAIKYGVTLDTSVSYITSQDLIVWDKDSSKQYYFNVAGIGNDSVSSLHQKQSRSQHTNTNDQVIIGLGEIAATNKDNMYGLQNGQFLVWGDNGNTQAMSASASSYVEFDYLGGTNNGRHMTRVWKVQNTGVNSDVLVRFPISSFGSTTLAIGDACAANAIIFADDEDFTTNVVAIELTENGLDYEAVCQFRSDMSYFTFARLTPLNNGTVLLPNNIESTTIYDDNCGVGEWVHFLKTSTSDQKLFALAGYPTSDLDSLEVVITPQGIGYNDGMIITNLMARTTTVIDSNKAPLPTGKVRVYYDTAELNATIVSGAQSSGWYKYEGDADTVMNDIFADGLCDTGMVISIVPVDSGLEDGVHYVEFHNIDSFSSFVFISSTEADIVVPLPVELFGFKAFKFGEKAQLTWNTATEENCKGFEVQSSENGKTWSVLGFENSKSLDGKSSEILNYDFIDESPADGVNFYRLKQFDYNGQYNFSPIVSLDFSSMNDKTITVVPNPTHDKIKISGLSGDNKIIIFNSLGKVIWKAKTSNVDNQVIDLSPYAPDVYFINVEIQNGTTKTFKLLKK